MHFGTRMFALITCLASTWLGAKEAKPVSGDTWVVDETIDVPGLNEAADLRLTITPANPGDQSKAMLSSMVRSMEENYRRRYRELRLISSDRGQVYTLRYSVKLWNEKAGFYSTVLAPSSLQACFLTSVDFSNGKTIKSPCNFRIRHRTQLKLPVTPPLKARSDQLNSPYFIASMDRHLEQKTIVIQADFSPASAPIQDEAEYLAKIQQLQHDVETPVLVDSFEGSRSTRTEVSGIAVGANQTATPPTSSSDPGIEDKTYKSFYAGLNVRTAAGKGAELLAGVCSNFLSYQIYGGRFTKEEGDARYTQTDFGTITGICPAYYEAHGMYFNLIFGYTNAKVTTRYGSAKDSGFVYGLSAGYSWSVTKRLKVLAGLDIRYPLTSGSSDYSDDEIVKLKLKSELGAILGTTWRL